MSDRISGLVQRIRDLESELEEEIDRRRAAFEYTVEKRRVVFETEVRERHRALRQTLTSYLSEARPMVILTAPVIYSVIVPLVLLDLFVTLYQAICFPVYRIEKVRRADYVSIDRRHLAYLNGLEKLNCVYCGYGNGLLAYASEIAARTEAHWCPIKHAARMKGTHAHYAGFLDYGDAEGYKQKKRELRESTR
ncbi:hypothetical protein [uncultured Marivita sp.]|uniref:hypothetical protein n=1 Tax=uncultured Marivita sp. TaxID=888080 RepID=UPI0026342A23|nr:hypothetical protein [uncultured Marivita sp.]